MSIRASDSVRLQGELQKKGSGALVDIWSVRYFQLRAATMGGSPSIAYWHDGTPRGIIHLFRSTAVYFLPGVLDSRFSLVNCKSSTRPGNETTLEFRAATPEECARWVDAIREVVAEFVECVPLVHQRIREVAFIAGLIQHRWYRLKRYHDCMIASELIGALVADGCATSRKNAVEMCQQLVRSDELHHVCDDHPFEDSSNYYRFTIDDTPSDTICRTKLPAPFHGVHETPDRVLLNLKQVMHVANANSLIQNRWYRLIQYGNCVIASELISQLVAAGCAPCRTSAVEMCQELVQYDELHHVCDDHPFEDTANFYRFTCQESEGTQLFRRKNPSPFVLERLSSSLCTWNHSAIPITTKSGSVLPFKLAQLIETDLARISSGVQQEGRLDLSTPQMLVRGSSYSLLTPAPPPSFLDRQEIAMTPAESMMCVSDAASTPQELALMSRLTEDSKRLLWKQRQAEDEDSTEDDTQTDSTEDEDNTQIDSTEDEDNTQIDSTEDENATML